MNDTQATAGDPRLPPLHAEIDRLRADNERLEELVKLEQSSQYAENKKLRAEIERLRAELDEVFEANGKLAYLASQNDRLRPALEGLYNEFSKSNDFRSDSKQAREARAALNKETKLND